MSHVNRELANSKKKNLVIAFQPFIYFLNFSKLHFSPPNSKYIFSNQTPKSLHFDPKFYPHQNYLFTLLKMWDFTSFPP